MRSIATLILCTSLGLSAAAQTTITNGGFENWGNASPGLSDEPTSWYSNKSGSAIAKLANATCFKDNSTFHTGTASVRVETITYLGLTVVNGALTTGVVNAPATDKSRGYIGTINYSSASDIRHMSFTGRPDSIVGWYKYTSGGTGEQGKVKVILHTGEYNDPEATTTDHPIDYSGNKIGDHTWLTPTSNVTTWTRFSMPIDYTSTSAPTYIMINATSSANQMTSVSGSKLWLDDLEAVYNPVGTCAVPGGLAASSITANSAVLSWSAPGSAVGAQYVIDGMASDPAAGTPMTAVTTSNFTASGLTANTTYYAHVRDSCGATLLSPWSMVMFTTLHAAGVNDVTSGNLSITSFPNPVKDEVTITVSGSAAATTGQLQLMDISGKVINTVKATSAVTVMSLSGLPSGLYLVRYTDAVNTQTVKISKQ